MAKNVKTVTRHKPLPGQHGPPRGLGLATVGAHRRRLRAARILLRGRPRIADELIAGPHRGPGPVSRPASVTAMFLADRAEQRHPQVFALSMRDNGGRARQMRGAWARRPADRKRTPPSPGSAGVPFSRGHTGSPFRGIGILPGLTVVKYQCGCTFDAQRIVRRNPTAFGGLTAPPPAPLHCVVHSRAQRTATTQRIVDGPGPRKGKHGTHRDRGRRWVVAQRPVMEGGIREALWVGGGWTAVDRTTRARARAGGSKRRFISKAS